MSRLNRFEDHRFIGDRRTMRVYDCDDAGQLSELAQLVETESLVGSNMLQSFAPDTLAEAENRGFRARRAGGEHVDA